MKRMSTTLLAASFLVVSHFAFGQNSIELNKGDKHYDQFEFPEALYFYEIANEQFPNSPSITRRIADTYRRMGDLSLTTEWYRRTLEADSSNAEDMIHYAEALKSIREYEAAIEWYEKYAEWKPSDKRAQSHIKNKYYFEDLQMDSLKYEMKKLKINNADPVIGLCLFENEKIIVSAVNLESYYKSSGMMEELPYLDLYVCDLSEDKELTNPIRLPKEVNSKFHDGPGYYQFKDRTLYITRNNIKGGKPVRDKNGSVNLKIYSSKYDGTNWTNAHELHFNSDSYSNGHPCVSKEGNAMYFVSNRPDGFGGTDLYMCSKLGGDWSEPSNLGATVNTEGDEMFPFLADDGRLFYASNGHAGLGGLDIFVSTKKSGVWSKPNNMGFPINSNQDDFGIVYDSESENGYFCSNRDGQNNDDLFAFHLIQLEKMIVAGTIRSALPQISLAHERIKIQSLNTGLVTEKILDANEAFSYEAVAGEKIQIQLVNSEYFDSNNSIFVFEAPNPLDDPYVNLGEAEVQFIKLPPMGSGVLADLIRNNETNGTKGALSEMLAKQGLSKSAGTGTEGSKHDDDGELENKETPKKNPQPSLSDLGTSSDKNDEANFVNEASILFDFDKSSIRDAAKGSLNEIAVKLKNDPSATLKIDAYCDSRGRKSYNNDLSQERADSVKKYLVKQGASSKQIIIKWYGEENLMNHCDDKTVCTETEHSVNRRAELIFVTEGLSSSK